MQWCKDCKSFCWHRLFVLTISLKYSNKMIGVTPKITLNEIFGLLILLIKCKCLLSLSCKYVIYVTISCWRLRSGLRNKLAVPGAPCVCLIIRLKDYNRKLEKLSDNAALSPVQCVLNEDRIFWRRLILSST